MGRNSSGGGGGGGGVPRGALKPDQWTSVGGGIEVKSGGDGPMDLLQIRKDGEYVGRMSYEVYPSGRGEIHDTVLLDSARGQRIIPQIWSTVERNFRARGAKSIKANVVDRAVGEKVWKGVGFKETTAWDGQRGTWTKEL